MVERLLVTSAAGTLEIYQDLAPLLGEDAVRSTSRRSIRRLGGILSV